MKLHQTKKGNNWFLGTGAHIGADTVYGLVHQVRGTAAKVSDVKMTDALMHGEEREASATRITPTRGRCSCSRTYTWCAIQLMAAAG